MQGFIADCRHAIRLYLRTPASSLVALGVLVVSMACVGAFLSLYVAMVMRPNPAYEPGGQLVTVIQSNGQANNGISLALIERINEEMPALGGLAGIARMPVPITAAPDGAFVRMSLVTREWFPSLRPRMVLGRGLEHEDHLPDAEPVVVISWAYWQNVFGGEPDVLDRVVEITNGVTALAAAGGAQRAGSSEPTRYRVVGVITPLLESTSRGSVDLWAPYERVSRTYSSNLDSISRTASFWSFYRKSRDTQPEAVFREINARYGQRNDEFTLYPGFRIDGVEGLVFDLAAHRQARRQLGLFLGGSVLLALVAAANVSLFLLARAPGRRRELTVRMAVGAPFRRLLRQLTTEAGLLVVAASVLGLALSLWLNVWMRGLALFDAVEWRFVTLLDWRVLGLVVLVVTVLTLFAGLTPVLDLWRSGILDSSRQRASRATLAQRIAGTAQVVVAAVLGSAALAFVWFLSATIFGSPGYSTRNLYLGNFESLVRSEVVGATLAVDAARRRDTILGVPGISAVSFGTVFPAPGSRATPVSIRDADDPATRIEFSVGQIDDRFVDLLDLKLISGRAPRAGEEGTALVNKALARQLFGRDDVVGESLPVSIAGGRIVTVDSPTTEVIGVLEDVSFGHPLGEVGPIAFAASPGGAPYGYMLIESSLDAAELRAALQGLVDSGALEIWLGEFIPMRAILNQVMAGDRVRAWLTIIVAGLVLVLTAFGFYGTQRYLVTAGRREYAIRSALGAGPGMLARLVYSRGLLMSLPGLAVGAVLSFATVAWLRDDYISRAISPTVVALAIAAALVGLLLLASFGPARQARATPAGPLLKED